MFVDVLKQVCDEQHLISTNMLSVIFDKGEESLHHLSETHRSRATVGEKNELRQNRKSDKIVGAYSMEPPILVGWKHVRTVLKSDSGLFLAAMNLSIHGVMVHGSSLSTVHTLGDPVDMRKTRKNPNNDCNSMFEGEN